MEPRLHLLKLRETAHEEASANQQHERQTHLRHDEDRSDFVTTWRVGRLR